MSSILLLLILGAFIGACNAQKVNLPNWKGISKNELITYVDDFSMLLHQAIENGKLTVPQDHLTLAMNIISKFTLLPSGMIGGCAGTQYGCCSGSTKAKADSAGTNCAMIGSMIGGCAGTQYGCCSGSSNKAKSDSAGTNCLTKMSANMNGMTWEQMLTPKYICSYAKEINQLITKEIKKEGTNAKKDADVAEVQKFLEEKKITPEIVKSNWLPLQEHICSPVIIGGCVGTRYGCCPNGSTVAKADIVGVNCDAAAVTPQLFCEVYYSMETISSKITKFNETTVFTTTDKDVLTKLYQKLCSGLLMSPPPPHHL